MKRYLLLFVFIGIASCDDILEVENISGDTVVLLAPADNVTLSVNDLILTWENLEEAESYQVQVASPTFALAQQIVKDTTITGNSLEIMLSNGDYQWRVRGKNSAYQTSYSTHTFSIEE